MKILGLDISSSCTGWSIINNGKLIEYNTISPVGSMGVTQRLYFFGNKIKEIIDTHKPDEVAAEETILVRGPKIMRTLARFSGVAFYWAYAHQKREIATYEPSMWKKNLGLRGNAKKPEIQLKVCERFNLLEKDRVLAYSVILSDIDEQDKKIRGETGKEIREMEKNIKLLEKETLQAKRNLKKIKKKDVVDNDVQLVDGLENKLKEIKELYKTTKKDYNSALRDVEKQYDKVSIDIYSDTGINNDIADSIGVAIKAMDDLNLEKPKNFIMGKKH